MQMMIKKIRVFFCSFSSIPAFCLYTVPGIKVINQFDKNDKCKQSEVLAFLVQNLRLLTFVIFIKLIDHFYSRYSIQAKYWDAWEAAKKNVNLFDHHLHEIFGLHSGTDYQTGPNFPNTNPGWRSKQHSSHWTRCNAAWWNLRQTKLTTARGEAQASAQSNREAVMPHRKVPTPAQKVPKRRRLPVAPPKTRRGYAPRRRGAYV